MFWNTDFEKNQYGLRFSRFAAVNIVVIIIQLKLFFYLISIQSKDEISIFSLFVVTFSLFDIWPYNRNYNHWIGGTTCSID